MAQINSTLSLFWKVEVLANMEVADVVEKNARFDFFEETIIREEDGRYSTPIPWTTDKWRLGKNFKLSVGRMDSTLRSDRCLTGQPKQKTAPV